ncbi:MAG: hypothetical protein JNL62_24840 [Bryobacterales bacterium]|nr:hypothetical protein [Bryobacterales bacterium]
MIRSLDDLRFAVRLHRRSMATSGAALLLSSLGHVRCWVRGGETIVMVFLNIAM